MPRKRSGDGTAPPRQRQRKKKDNANTMADMKMEMPSMSYEPQGMSNGMGHGMIPDDGSGAYGHAPHDYYQYGGPTSAASGSMNNGYGPPSQLAGPPPGSATPMGFQDPDVVQAQLAGHPAYGMQPGTASQPPSMLPTPGPIPGAAPNVANGVNSQAGSVPPNPMMIRHMPMGIPPPPLLEYRIHEMNKRLYAFAHDGVAAHHHLAWWEAFVHEFFDDDAKMSITTIESQEVTKRYLISRYMLIKFFRNLFDSGVKELCFIPRGAAQERMTWNGLCALECDSATMLTKLDKPVTAQANTDARMFIEFAAYDDTCGYRIKGFNLELRNTQEFIAPNVNLDPETQEKVRHGITTCGLPIKSIHFLKLSVIVESMMTIITHCKQNPTVPPREGLKTVLFEYHLRQKNAQSAMTANMPQQNAMPVPPVEEPVKKQPRKRTRKPNNTNSAGSTTPAKQRKGNSRASPAHPTNNFPMNPNYSVQQQFPQEVLVVGEPSLMGNDFSEDDERSISRIENTQFDVTGGMGHMGANQIGMLPPANGSGGLPSNGTIAPPSMYSRQNSFNLGPDLGSMPPPQAASVARGPPSNQQSLSMLQPPPSYESSMMANTWNGMNTGNMNTPLMAQAICDQ